MLEVQPNDQRGLCGRQMAKASSRPKSMSSSKTKRDRAVTQPWLPL